MDAPADSRSESDDGHTGGVGSTETPETADSLERLLALVGPRVDEVRSLLGDSTSRWRGDALRVGEGSKRRAQELARELGLVTRDEYDELELRVAQLEHRLRLLEQSSTLP
jgi:hypothetical protein